MQVTITYVCCLIACHTWGPPDSALHSRLPTAGAWHIIVCLQLLFLWAACTSWAFCRSNKDLSEKVCWQVHHLHCLGACMQQLPIGLAAALCLLRLIPQHVGRHRQQLKHSHWCTCSRGCSSSRQPIALSSSHADKRSKAPAHLTCGIGLRRRISTYPAAGRLQPVPLAASQVSLLQPSLQS